MAKIQKDSSPLMELQDLVKDITSQIKSNSTDHYIPDILEFCDSPEFLNFPGQGIQLFPMQKIILTVFYRGQPGNEHLQLTGEQYDLLRKNNLQSVIEKYESGNAFRELVLVLGRRCVGEDTLLCDPISGDMKTVGQLWDSGIKNVVTTSLDEKSYDMHRVCKSEIIPSGDQEVYRVTLADGRSIDVTANHPFLTIDGWTPLDKLTISDRVAVPKEIKIDGSVTMTDEEAALLGYMIGDGCCTTHNIFYTSSNESNLKLFEKCLCAIDDNLCIKKDIWSTSSSNDYAYKITKKHYEFEQFQRNDGSIATRPSKNGLAKLLQSHGILGCNAHNKFVPSAIFQANKNIVKHFLKALFSSDGSGYFKWNKRDNKFKPGITYTSVSRKLAYGIHHLLIRFGIVSYIRKRQIKSNFKSTTGFSYQIDISAARDIRKFIQEIGFTNRSQEFLDAMINYSHKDVGNSCADTLSPKIWNYIDELKRKNGIKTDRELLGVATYDNARCHRLYGPNRKRIKHINDLNFQDNWINCVCNENIFWMKIKSIVKLGMQRTFDIAVPEDDRHNFLANDIIIHNSGKNFLSSVISLYEAMRLLEVPGGCPVKYYGLSVGSPIFILTVATSAEQANLLFTEIKSKAVLSPYFQNKIGMIGRDKIWLLTPNDIDNKDKIIETNEDKKAGASKGFKGSVVFMSGHSNSPSLLGKRIYVLLFDEVASYGVSGGVKSGDEIYRNLLPATADFKRKIGCDDNGQSIYRLDSKVISISSPRSEEGVLFKLYNNTPITPSRLAFKLPTWKINQSQIESELRETYKDLSPAAFAMEFGAEFSGMGGEKFIPDVYVDKALDLGFSLGLDQRQIGLPGVTYYAHLDPASTSHNYALVLLHVENRIRISKNEVRQYKERFSLFVVDHIMVWQPQPNEAIKVSEVDKYILNLAQKFRIGMVSYDAWNSLASIQKLRSQGVPTKITPYRSHYKQFIYTHLEELLTHDRLALPRKGKWAGMMEMELKCLRRIHTPTGFKIKPNPEGQITTDDLCDSLAGACATAVNNVFNGYPSVATVYLPEGNKNRPQWSIGNGAYTDPQWKYIHQKFKI